MSDKKIPLAGVIGSPVGHSRSPRLHATWLRRYGIPGHYVPMDVAQDDLADALVTLPKLGFVGLNVTIPHKERVLELSDIVTDRAAVIGAANTLIFRKDGKIHADNTDGFGFIENLKHNARNWRPKDGPTLVLGAGGAARAVVVALMDAGVPEIRLANRTRARSEALRSEFGAKIQVIDWVHAGAALDSATTLVNTTSLGMSGQPELKVRLDNLSSDMTVTDLVYSPLKTPLLALAEERGCDVVDGLGMLIYQAVPGFERWFGQRPAVDEDIRNAVLGDAT